MHLLAPPPGVPGDSDRRHAAGGGALRLSGAGLVQDGHLRDGAGVGEERPPALAVPQVVLGLDLPEPLLQLRLHLDTTQEAVLASGFSSGEKTPPAGGHDDGGRTSVLTSPLRKQ